MTDDYQLIREALNDYVQMCDNAMGTSEHPDCVEPYLEHAEKALAALDRLNGRVLPELPDGYRIDGVSEFHNGWLATLRHKNGGKIVWSNEFPDGRFPTAREAISAAIKKIGEQT